MTRTIPRRLLLLFLAASALAMEMEMGMEMGEETMTPTASRIDAAHKNRTPSSYAATLTPTPTPTPHEPKHVHGLPILQQQLTPNERAYWEAYSTTTFFNLPPESPRSQKQVAKIHTWLVALVTCVGYPVALMLGHVAWKNVTRTDALVNSDDMNNHDTSTSTSTSTTPPPRHFLKFCHAALTTANVSSLILAIVLLSGFSDPAVQYPKNAYRRTCIVVAAVSILHLLATVVRYLGFVKNARNKALASPQTSHVPLENYEMVASNERHHSQSSHDSELTAATSASSHTASSHGKPAARQGSPLDTDSGFDYSPHTDLEMHRRSLAALSANQLPVAARIASVVLNFTSWPLFILLAIHCVIGIAVGNLFGRGLRVFNLLAHWIKGGVFVTLGIVSLARYCGCGVNKGWAWNKTTVQMHPTSAVQNWRHMVLPNGSMITMEFIESFLIFFYGSTNVFLEHLSNVDGQWHAKDLQHVSIAFMFIGCGLCGLIVEYKLSDWRKSQSVDESLGPLTTGTPGYTLNPFPAFTIFWTGILMSQHAQASVTSTNIHVQWGYLLSYGSFFRILTFLLLVWKPNQDNKPSRPFTELIASFCLLCGGLIFMESTDQVVEALEYRGLTSMFTFNLSVGFVTLFMAWEMILLLWKDCLEKR
ncbi:LAME_0H15038g1_1 [Lachancea meyersii CBS 8951]|uniref:LAME_0H15038g1_1 n=1 Tax=Lachancea meyersii CBS 8951 TaxID=1266667 RepID=A0A1G4KHH0_9SACH|nr:LAME_0H15038g1_1 [Lachancea meyersii CBS 8951]